LLKKNKIKLGVVTKSHVELNQLAMKAQMELISIRKRELLWQRVKRNLTNKKNPKHKTKQKKKKRRGFRKHPWRGGMAVFLS